MHRFRRVALSMTAFSLLACQVNPLHSVTTPSNSLRSRDAISPNASSNATAHPEISRFASEKSLPAPKLSQAVPQTVTQHSEKQTIQNPPAVGETDSRADPQNEPISEGIDSQIPASVSTKKRKSGGGGGAPSNSAQSTPESQVTATPQPSSTPIPQATVTPTPQPTASVLASLENASCSFQVGTNFSDLVDWSTEIPFVDLMKLSRTWITYELDDPNWTWDTGNQGQLAMRTDGYPTHLPQSLPGTIRPTALRTVWADTQAWPAGTYTVLYDGTGQITFRGVQNLQTTAPGRLSFDVMNPQPGDLVEMRLLQSDANDPVHNIRVLMPGTESSYQSQPYYQPWLQEAQRFAVLRFMDWGKTNNWGFGTPWDTQADTSRMAWSQRAQPDNYTWTTHKGIPYEMMAQTANALGKDIWLTVPHNASDEYIREMARFFRDHLDSNRTVYLEYSNEIWNWMFGQTKWLNDLGDQNVAWPERTVPFIQNVMDIWTEEYAGQMERLVRVVGVQGASWGLSQRFASNLRTGSFDAIAPAAYFHINTAGYTELANLGANATADDVIRVTQASLAEGLAQLQDLKTKVADPLGVPMLFYEGGQHLTPQPFGTVQPYNQALMDAQRHPGMRTLYDDWFAGLHQILQGQATVFANFSFVKQLSGQYGSWGILESMTQDRNVIPAPKYEALMQQINSCGG